MLVLGRQVDEVVEIGGGFKVGGVDVTVVSINGDKVRLGFEAPEDVTVHRFEVAQAIREANRAAAAPVPLVDSHVRVPGMAVVVGKVNARP